MDMFGQEKMCQLIQTIDTKFDKLHESLKLHAEQLKARYATLKRRMDEMHPDSPDRPALASEMTETATKLKTLTDQLNNLPKIFENVSTNLDRLSENAGALMTIQDFDYKTVDKNGDEDDEDDMEEVKKFVESATTAIGIVSDVYDFRVKVMFEVDRNEMKQQIVEHLNKLRASVEAYTGGTIDEFQEKSSSFAADVTDYIDNTLAGTVIDNNAYEVMLGLWKRYYDDPFNTAKLLEYIGYLRLSRQSSAKGDIQKFAAMIDDEALKPQNSNVKAKALEFFKNTLQSKLPDFTVSVILSSNQQEIFHFTIAEERVKIMKVLAAIDMLLEKVNQSDQDKAYLINVITNTLLQLTAGNQKLVRKELEVNPNASWDEYAKAIESNDFRAISDLRQVLIKLSHEDPDIKASYHEYIDQIRADMILNQTQKKNI